MSGHNIAAKSKEEQDKVNVDLAASSGYAVVNRALRVKQGAPILINHCGRTQFAKLMGKSLITAEGEALEGESLDDVDVIGVVTFLINSALQESSDQSPI